MTQKETKISISHMGNEHKLEEGKIFPGGYWIKLNTPEGTHRFPSGTDIVSFICLYSIFEELAKKCQANGLDEAAVKAKELADIFLEQIN